MRQIIRKSFSCLIFLVILTLLLGRVSEAVRHKVRKGDVVASFYKEPKDSIDVLYVGSSMCYSFISPMDIWGSEGITGFALATPNQTIPASYYLIKEGIRTQHPSVVVLEIFGAKYTSKPGIMKLHEALDDIPLGPVKIEAFMDLLPEVCETFDERFEFLFPFLKYHSRWSEVDETDFKNEYAFLKGALVTFNVKETQEARLTKKEKNLTELVARYLEKILDLCEKENIPLVFLRTPSGNFDGVKAATRRTNRALRMGEEGGAAVLDLFEVRDELGLDYEHGYRDGHHGNSVTQKIVSEYVGAWLKEHYDLPDHRGDKNYQYWQEDYERYLDYRAAAAGRDDEVLDEE